MAKKIIALIPARGGSKSIPLKNIKPLGGKPLIYWTLKAASDCTLINNIYLATDNLDIKKIALGFNLNKVNVFDRNKNNAEDTSSTESLIIEFLNTLKFNPEDLLILMQATSPFTNSIHLTEAILKFNNSNANSLISVVDFKRFIWNQFGVPLNYNYNKRPRRQDFNGYYLENGAFYISRIKNILLNNNRLSKDICLYIMPNYTSLELDEPEDWFIAEQYIKNFSR